MSSFVNIDKFDNTLKFKSLDNTTVSLSVFRREDVSNRYTQVLEDVTFTDTYTYTMEKNNLYKFVFKATIDSDTLIGPWSSPPQVPPMPELPTIKIPEAPDALKLKFAPSPTGADIFLAKITAETFAVNAKAAKDKVDALKALIEKTETELQTRNVNQDKAELEQLKLEAEKAQTLADLAQQEATNRGQSLIESFTQLDEDLNKVAVNQRVIKSFSIAVDNYNTEKNLYNSILATYEKARNQYENQLAAFNADVDRHQIIRKQVIYEYTIGYYPDLLDSIITGCVYTLNRTEDVDVLYNNKDRQANTTILRILYYNALCYGLANENYAYALSSIYFRLKHNMNLFETSEYHRGLDNTFVQEKLIIGAYYIAYMLDALRFTENTSGVLNRFKFDKVFPALKLMNIDINRIANDLGIKFTSDANNSLRVGDITIVLENRQVYNFKREDFIKDDYVVNTIMFMTVPDEGTLYYNDVKVELGQKINFEDIDNVKYIAKDVNYSYLSSFKFLLE